VVKRLFLPGGIGFIKQFFYCFFVKKAFFRDLIRYKFMADGKSLSARIKAELKRQNKKPGELYRFADITSQAPINWRNKNSIPAADTALKIAEFLDVSVKWLITGEEEPGLSRVEQDLLASFRQLDERDQSDVLGNIKMKLENAKEDKSIDKSADKQSKGGKDHPVRGKGA
jgi:transcriptional regulator with XRE-family HTH domain